MSQGMSPLSLAYLIEISIIINLAYREIKYHSVRNTIISKLDAAKDTIAELKEAPSLFEEYEHLKNLRDGTNNDSWQGHKWRRWFYKNLLNSGLAYRIVTGLIIYNILMLFFITFLADIEISFGRFAGCLDAGNAIPIREVLWIVGYLSLIATICIPLVFMFLDRLCRNYLFGKDGKTGRVYGLTARLEKWMQRVEKMAAELRV